MLPVVVAVVVVVLVVVIVTVDNAATVGDTVAPAVVQRPAASGRGPVTSAAFDFPVPSDRPVPLTIRSTGQNLHKIFLSDNTW